MSLTRVPWTGSGPGGSIVVGDKWGQQKIEATRQMLDQSGYIGGHYDLGGDNVAGILSASLVQVNSFRQYLLDGDQLGGLTLEAVTWCRTLNAATSVQLQVWNVDASAQRGLGTVRTDTTPTREVITVTLDSGPAWYDLRIVGGDALNEIYGWGYFRLRLVP